MSRFALPALCCASIALAACGGEREPAASDSGNSASAPAAGAPPASEADVSPAPASSTVATAAPETPDADQCGASKVDGFIGQEATPAVRADLQAKVGHDRIRWVGPDTAVTMDFRPDRLNVMLNDADVITDGKCT